MTEPLDVTDALLAEVDRLRAAATPGPWACVGHELYYGNGRAGTPHQQIPREADALFMAHSRTIMPALAAEVRRLRGIEASAASLRQAFYAATESFQKHPTRGMHDAVVKDIWATLYEAVRDHQAGLAILADNARLREIVTSLADRCAGQSEVLSRRAEKGAAP